MVTFGMSRYGANISNASRHLRERGAGDLQVDGGGMLTEQLDDRLEHLLGQPPVAQREGGDQLGEAVVRTRRHEGSGVGHTVDTRAIDCRPCSRQRARSSAAFGLRVRRAARRSSSGSWLTPSRSSLSATSSRSTPTAASPSHAACACVDIGVDPPGQGAVIDERLDGGVGQRVDRVGADQLVDVQRVGIGGVLRRGAGPQRPLHALRPWRPARPTAGR